jgi:hypothetical protein
VRDHPLRSRVALLDGHRVAGLRREVVLGEDYRQTGTDDQFADQTVMGVSVPEHPARTMDV